MDDKSQLDNNTWFSSLLLRIFTGATSLHDAADSGSQEQVDSLIKKGVNIDAKTYDGWTALHHAVKNGYMDIIETLLIKGANVNVRLRWPTRGATPLHIAVEHGRKDIAELLISNGTNDISSSEIDRKSTRLNSSHGYISY